MATYCIGDLHGCCNEFLKLLDLIRFDENSDELILTGDLIGRGPLPAETMREILKLKGAVTAVLGNHDLNFLAVYEGIVKARAKDNLTPLLNDPDCGEFVKFMLDCPLLLLHKRLPLAVAHAGLYPLWELAEARKISKEVCKVLRDPIRRKVLLMNMYRDEPAQWDPALAGLPKWRFALNAFTRMRLCTHDAVLDFKLNSVSPDQAKSSGYYPWFDLLSSTKYKKKPYTLVFGHWAALNGHCALPEVKALDTGCVWGGKLTAWCAEEDKFYSVKSPGYIVPAAAQVSKT